MNNDSPLATSVADIIINDEMLAHLPAAKLERLSIEERNTIFRRLRALKRAFGRKPNKNELAIALIGACIVEGFDTLGQIVGALEAVSERQRNGGRSGSDVIPGGCETRPGRHHVGPDRPRAA